MQFSKVGPSNMKSLYGTDSARSTRLNSLDRYNKRDKSTEQTQPNTSA